MGPYIGLVLAEVLCYIVYPFYLCFSYVIFLLLHVLPFLDICFIHRGASSDKPYLLLEGYIHRLIYSIVCCRSLS